jgi:flagellar hook-basal body complex protein FliE
MPIIDPTAAGAASGLQTGQAGGAGSEASGTSFQEMLTDAVQTTDSKQKDANGAILETMTGGESSLHETMVTMEKASVSMKLMVQVRNKAVDAYKEVMRMQV